MSMEIDETLQIFIEESLEHLSDIENDFLAIEAAGADIDEDMVNKVYRAAHSIKGGAGFMGLTNIKDLTHEMENILGKIRSREMVPNPEIINIMLNASDMLKQLIEDVASSNEVDIAEHVASLKLISETISSDKEEISDPHEEALSDLHESDEESAPLDTPFDGCEALIADEKKAGKNVYQIEFDLISDLHKKGKKLGEFITELEQTGSILKVGVKTEKAGELVKNFLPDNLPVLLIFATIFKPEDVNILFEIDENQIFEIADDLSLTPIIDAASIPEEAPPEPSFAQSSAPEKKYVEMETTKYPETCKPEDEVKPQAVEKKVAPPAKKNITKTSKVSKETSLRVTVTLLDSLMTLAGELVLARNQLVQGITLQDRLSSEAASQRVDMITSELQEAIMFTRMQPIGNVFSKFPRVVRDLAKTLNKDVELSIEGNEVELDKTIIEAISDPLTHLVRNSVDHGIEIAEVRRKSGKNIQGNIVLRAYHESGQVNIEITDDGKGLDGDKLAEAALAKGIITEDQSKIMSDKEKIHLIFMPGFSTAKEVTDVSGRGVGMDVVKTNLDKLGGVVDIDSSLGKGTSIKIKLPLTLAIIASQIIVTGEERYAIPQVNLQELLRIPADQVKDKIEKVGDAAVVRLRGELLPLVKLADVIDDEGSYLSKETGEMKKDMRKNIADRRSKKSSLFDEGEEDETKNISKDPEYFERKSKDRRVSATSSVNIAVVSAGATKYGLVVDQLLDSEEIVVKPLGRHLKHCTGYAGATIMGDGRVALIVDVSGIAKMAKLTSVDGSSRAAHVHEEASSKGDSMSLLVFRNAEDEQFCVPLNLVLRIEKIKRKEIETIGEKKLIQYRGTSLPLVSIDDVADVKPLADKEDLLVIVFMISGMEAGLLASSPLDAVDVAAQFDETILKQSGIMGSAIIDKTTTLMIDIFGVIQSSFPEWFAEIGHGKDPDEQAPSILYAEDSNFFRSQVKGFMEEAGYNVIEAEDGIIGWDLLQKHGDEIDMVVTDVEMPNLDGIGFAEKIRGDQRFSHLPLIALTTLAGEEEVKRGKEAGIDEYLIKLDREKLLMGIKNLLGD